MLVDMLQQHPSLDPYERGTSNFPILHMSLIHDSVRDSDRDRQQRSRVSQQQISGKQPSAMR